MTTPEEVWLPIVGYEGYYEVSSHGRFRSLDRTVLFRTTGSKFEKGRIKTPSVNNKGYYIIGLWKDRKRKTFNCHRILAETFIANAENLPAVNHKDLNKLNNALDNLEWCTYQYNTQHAAAAGKMVGGKNNLGKVNERCVFSKPIVQLSSDERTIIAFYPCAQEAGRQGYCGSSIRKCLRKERPHHKGYMWYYLSDVSAISLLTTHLMNSPYLEIGNEFYLSN